MATPSIFPKAIYLSCPVRTPIGKFGGSLQRFSAPELATLALKEGLQRADGLAPAELVFMGHGRQAGAGPNPARQATIFAGLPPEVPAVTVNQACASGLASIIAACDRIALGKAHVAWAGGVESMSNTPYFLPQARWGYRMGHAPLVDGMTKDGFFCPMSDMVMGETVENFLVPEFKVSREEQDAYALETQLRAARAWQAGHFKAETFAIAADGKKPGLDHDEHRREDTTAESLAKLGPVFKARDGRAPTITAGNSSGITDGAAFVRVSDARDAGTVAEILDYEVVALDPRRMGIGPVPAVRNLLARRGLQIGDIEAFEVNEAFAAQVIACQRDLKIPTERLNAWGGSIALGHPIGATGTRITVTLLSRLRDKPGALGLATLCVSGGMGVALLVRSV